MGESSPSRYSRRAALLGGISLLAAGAGGYALADSAPRLFVFVPTFVRARALEDLLGAGMPGVNVTVFGRFADFMSAVLANRPEGALSLADGLLAIGLEPKVQGLGALGPDEPYVLLTKEKSASLPELAKDYVGIVEVVGRRALPGLVRDLLGVPSPPPVRRVLKMGDLLPLLHLDLAASVVLPERLNQEFQRMSRLNLRVVRPPRGFLKRAALGYPGGVRNAAIENALRAAPANVRSALGVESWRF
jgi:hypothetical protein